MIADDIAQDIFNKERELIREDNYHPENKPSFVVYMGHEAYMEMMSEIVGQVSRYAMEVMNNGTIQGHRVYRVCDVGHPWIVFMF